MPSILYTVDNIIEEIRSQVDEQNVDSVSTAGDILPSVNRGQLYAFDILARRYPEPILQHTVLTLIAGQAEYDIPEDVFEDRILKMEIGLPSGSDLQSYREVTRISYRDLTLYETSTPTNIPSYYCIVGRKIRMIGVPSGTYNARVWSLRNPEKLVEPQGRVTIVNTAGNYVIVDSAGISLTTESDQLGSYVNIIDGQTGEIKGSLQIQILDSNKVTFRTVPTRDTVLNRAIGTSLLDSDMAPIVAEDDYLSPIQGTCVPYFGQPTTNFLIQFAVAEITRKLGGAADAEEKVLEKFEKQVAETWAGREITLRIKKKSRKWGVPYRRWWGY